MPAHRADRHPSPQHREEPDPGAAASMRWGQRATALVLLGVLLTGLPHPWSLLGLPVTIAALALALRAVVGHVRGSRWGWAAWHLVAVGFAGYLLLVASLQAMFPAQLTAWSDCSKAAQTRQAQTACDQRLSTSTPAWLRGVVGSAQ